MKRSGNIRGDDEISLPSSVSEGSIVQSLRSRDEKKFDLRSIKTYVEINISDSKENDGQPQWPVKWPNSIEDRDNKSSSNPPISTSLSDGGSGDQQKDLLDPFHCNMLSNQYHQCGQKADESWRHQSVVKEVDDLADCEDSGSEDLVKKTDSLPRHRERLMRKKRIKPNRNKNKLLYSSSSSQLSSSSSETISGEISSTDPEINKKFKLSNDKTTEKALKKSPLIKSECNLVTANTKPERPITFENFCESDNQPSKMENVGSWLALQKFHQYSEEYQALALHQQRLKLSLMRSPYDVLFNVSGQRYIVDTRTLARYPNSMLGNKEKRDQYWDKKKNEYFLDRHRATFEVMLEFYTSNDTELRRPDEIPIDVFIHEIKYYYFDREIIKKFLQTEGILRQVKKKELPSNKVKQEIWKLFEDPESSQVARCVTSISAAVIAISVCVFCVETVPSFNSWGHKVNETIEPSITACRLRLQNHTELFDARNGIFKVEVNDEKLVKSTIIKRSLKQGFENAKKLKWLAMEKNPPRFSYFHLIEEDFESTDEPTTSVIDTFDSQSVIETLQRMLKECTSTEPKNLYKYINLRCEMELNDGLSYKNKDSDSIHRILRHIEVHDDHEHDEETIHQDGHFEDSHDAEKSSDKKINPKIPQKLIKKQINKQTGRRRKRANVNHHAASNYTTDKMTLKQASKALIDVCHALDKHSIRSSYAWYVLEASMDGPAGLLFLIESGCIVWFVIELGLRFLSCPNKTKFCASFLNIIDIVAIMPYFITLIVTSLHTDSNLRPQTATILRTIRLVRMLRILKLSRHSRGLRILGLTLIRSTRVLVLLVCFQMVLAVTFSSIVYNVELYAKKTQYESIPDAFWWAIITMTTVGYGDVVPVTPAGKLTGTFCAILGILGIAFPVPVIVSNFNYLYNLDRDDCKLDPDELTEKSKEQEAQDLKKKFDRFEEHLFDAVRKNVGSMSSAPNDNNVVGQNPADLWNQARRQYRNTGAKSDRRRRSDGSWKSGLARGVTAMATASLLSTAMPYSAKSGSAFRSQKATSI